MKPFTDILRDIRKGRIVEEATAKLALATIAALDTGKPATVTLTLAVKPEKGGETVEIIPTVKVKTPEADLPKAVFYVTRDEEGVDLMRTDPNQRPLFDEVDSERAYRAPAAV
jgi:hypothetical protein